MTRPLLIACFLGLTSPAFAFVDLPDFPTNWPGGDGPAETVTRDASPATTHSISPSAKHQ